MSDAADECGLEKDESLSVLSDDDIPMTPQQMFVAFAMLEQYQQTTYTKHLKFGNPRLVRIQLSL